jgi:predicted nucleotidyltransferase
MAQKKQNLRSSINSILLELFKQKGIRVSKIVLFGSLVRGVIKKDSDIDLIVISKDFRDKSIFERVELTTGIGRELVKRTKKPFDIMYYSDLEWNKGHSLIINAAKKEGKVIYG